MACLGFVGYIKPGRRPRMGATWHRLPPGHAGSFPYGGGYGSCIHIGGWNLKVSHWIHGLSLLGPPIELPSNRRLRGSGVCFHGAGSVTWRWGEVANRPTMVGSVGHGFSPFLAHFPTTCLSNQIFNKTHGEC